jgi:hypothetical protein
MRVWIGSGGDDGRGCESSSRWSNAAAGAFSKGLYGSTELKFSSIISDI